MRDKATITLDREKARLAQELSGATSMSATVDMALDHLIHECRIRKDIEAYKRCPQGEEEAAMAMAGGFPDLDDDDVDWEALYPEWADGR